MEQRLNAVLRCLAWLLVAWVPLRLLREIEREINRLAVKRALEAAHKSLVRTKRPDSQNGVGFTK